MARLVGPDEGSRFGYGIRSDNAITTAGGLVATVWADAGGTQLADILTLAGAAIVGSRLTLGADSLIPLFQFPDNVKVLYSSVNGGPVVPVYARATDQVSAAQADAATKYASVVQLPASSGTDDTATINALLAANAGKRVRGLPGQTYLTSAPLVVYSGTELDMTGCTVTLKAGSNCNMLNNAGVTANRSVADGAATAASTTLTSATAAFTSADIGSTVTVSGAATAGQLLVTTITAVGSATSATMALAASTTTSAATVTVYRRDSGITVVGGTWDRGSNGGVGSGLHSIRFRHVDGLTLRDMTMRSAAGKYAYSIGDVTNVQVSGITLAGVFSDGVHLTGPSSNVTIRDIFGTAGDDFVAITPQDWAAYADTLGDVTDVTIENLYPVNTHVSALKLLGGQAGALKRVRVRNIYGSTAGTTGALWIGDDSAQAGTTGGVIDAVLIENVSTAVPNGGALISLNGTATRRVRFKGIHFDNASSTSAVIQINPATAATYAHLIFEDIAVPACGVQPIINAVANATITSLIVDRATIPAAVAWDLIFTKGTIADLIVRGVVGAGNGYLLNLDQNTAGATVTRATFTDIHLAGSAGGGLIRAIASGQTLPNVAVSASMLNNMAWLADVNTVTEVDLSGVVIKSPGQGIANLRANAVVTFAGDGNALTAGAQGIKVAAGGKASVRLIDCPPSTTAGGFPTIAAGAGAGTAPTVTVAGTDRAGTVTITPGTTPAAGVQATVTFVGTWSQAPKVSLTPTSAAAQAAGAYVSSKTTTTFVISTANTPSGAMTFDYVIAA